MHLTEVQREQISAEVELLARKALDRLGCSESGFLVVVNGGRRQDVRQVHFHLVTDGYELTPVPSGLQPEAWTDHSDPSCEVHQIRTGQHPLHAGLIHAEESRETLQLDRRGYSIIWDTRTTKSEGVVHLTAGGSTDDQ